MSATQEIEIEEECPYPPWNFSWVVANQLAAMAWPQTTLSLEYLAEEGIKHLVSLSAEKLPPMDGFTKMSWTQIPVDEFEAPSVEDIVKFIDICKECHEKNQAVGVHCRMGRGRTGVMAACYLMYFQDLTPERAITDIRLQRPGSVETPEQERAVKLYHDNLRGIQNSDSTSTTH